MKSKEIEEILVCKACPVHRVRQGGVGWSTHAGGGPLVRVCREQSWSTVEELEGATTITKEEPPTISVCPDNPQYSTYAPGVTGNPRNSGNECVVKIMRLAKFKAFLLN